MNTEYKNYLNTRDDGCDYINMKDMESRVHPEIIPHYQEFVELVRQPVGDAYDLPWHVTSDLKLAEV